MFYRPEQAGWNKTMACRHYCSELNPDTVFEVHNINITTEENKQKLKVLRGPRLGVGWGRGGGCGWGGVGGRLCRAASCGAASDLVGRPAVQETVASGSLDRKSAVSMVIGCVDNFEARQVMEAVSEELQVPFMDAVVGDDAMTGHVQLIIPGRTGGLEAAPIKKQKDKRPGECPASLATTDSIIAGITAQNALKYLLGFGEVAFLLSYNAITNDFTTRMYARARLQPASRRATTHTPECRRLRRTYPDPRKLAAPGSLPE